MRDQGNYRLFAKAAGLVCVWAWLAGFQSAARAQTSVIGDDQGKIVKVVVKKVTVTVLPEEGYLALFATEKAQVVLTPASEQRLRDEAAKPRGEKCQVVKASAIQPLVKSVGPDGYLVFPKLAPGGYELSITRDDDYEPLPNQFICIERGEVTAYSGLLRPKYGTIVLGLGTQMAENLTAWLNGDKVSSSQLEAKEGKLYIKHVEATATVQEIKLTRPGYNDWVRQRVIQRGECNNFIPVEMVRPTLTLTVETQPPVPNAQVFVDGSPKGITNENGRLRIPGTGLDARELRVSLAGYKEFADALKFPADASEAVTVVKLEPLAADPEVNVDFGSQISYWTPNLPAGWSLRQDRPIGLDLSGNAIGLLKNNHAPNRPFNYYWDFTLLLNLSLANGNSPSWIVRAQDDRNYYRFELTTNAQKETKLNFYICRPGGDTCGKPVRSDDVDPELVKGNSLRIAVEVQGNQMLHCLANRGNVLIGGRFRDDSFKFGGVGLAGKGDLKTVVQEFKVIPGISGVCRTNGR